MVDVENTTGDDFAALFEESLKQEEIKEGDIVRGTVIAVAKDYAIVDIGYKSEGQVPLDEFRGADGFGAVGEGGAAGRPGAVGVVVGPDVELGVGDHSAGSGRIFSSRSMIAVVTVDIGSPRPSPTMS